MHNTNHCHIKNCPLTSEVEKVKAQRKHHREQPKRNFKTEGRNCMSHGAGCGHSSESCRVLQQQAKHMKVTCNSQAPSEKSKHNQKKELHALFDKPVEQRINDAAKKAAKHAVAKAKKRQNRESYNFEQLKIDDSDSDSDVESSDSEKE